jgi:hypothetical protein
VYPFKIPCNGLFHCSDHIFMRARAAATAAAVAAAAAAAAARVISIVCQ